VQAGKARQPNPHLLAHEFQMTGFTWEHSGSREDFGYRDAQKTPRSQNPPRYEVPRRARASRQPQVPAPRPGMTAAPSWPVPGTCLHNGAWRCLPSATLIRAGSSLRRSVAVRVRCVRTWYVVVGRTGSTMEPGSATITGAVFRVHAGQPSYY
jgi:hypothetical protein